MTIREMRRSARLLLLFATACHVAGLVLLLATEVRPATGVGLLVGELVAAVVGGHRHGAADERGRRTRS